MTDDRWGNDLLCDFDCAFCRGDAAEPPAPLVNWDETHGFTCGECSWGRDKVHTWDEWQRHLRASHAGHTHTAAEPPAPSPYEEIARLANENAARLRGEPPALDVEWLRAAITYGIERQLGPGSAIEFDSAIGSAVAEYARLAREEGT